MPNPQETKTDESQKSQAQSVSRDVQSRLAGLPSAYPFGFGGTPGELFRMGPFAFLKRMHDEVDRVFGLNRSAGGGGSWTPAVEVSQKDNTYTVTAELPGIDPSNVKVEVTQDAVVLQGERRTAKDEERGGVHHSERSYGSFYRSIPLPEGANAEQARAHFENGMLEINVPVKENAQRRQIPIESGGKGPATKAA